MKAPPYPTIFLQGPQALLVSSALDPDSLLLALAQRGFRPRLWTAKLTGDDTGGRAEIEHGMARARSNGLRVGGWVQCGTDPRADVNSVAPWAAALDYVCWCCEIEYKSNAGPVGDAHRADLLLGEVQGSVLSHHPQAVVSYGKRDLAMRLGVFARAGWAVIPEAYDAFSLADADSYLPLWPGRAIHPLLHSLALRRYRGNRCGLYRPESLL